ncbi:MAG TPA: hypothetical protein VFV37_06560, partial [Luteibaculaceae bacterium]|nr:hypothetical protein [Luteibaculaceae bacterium]
MYANGNPLKYVDPSGEFLTWSIHKGGFSLGLNFSLIGIALGFGVNIGWGNGGSVGVYGEVGYPIGGSGFGAGSTVSQSLDYNFKYRTATTTTGLGAYASFGPLNAGANVSSTYNLTHVKHLGYSWGVSAGIGMGNEKVGIGLFVGYGSGGWNYGLGGYYDPSVKFKEQKVALVAKEDGSFEDDLAL